MDVLALYRILLGQLVEVLIVEGWWEFDPLVLAEGKWETTRTPNPLVLVKGGP